MLSQVTLLPQDEPGRDKNKIKSWVGWWDPIQTRIIYSLNLDLIVFLFSWCIVIVIQVIYLMPNLISGAFSVTTKMENMEYQRNSLQSFWSNIIISLIAFATVCCLRFMLLIRRYSIVFCNFSVTRLSSLTTNVF